MTPFDSTPPSLRAEQRPSAPERLHEEVLGEAEVWQVFDLSGRRGNKANMVAGCVVNSGSFSAVEKFRLLRDGEPVHEGLLDAQSIRRHRLEVTTVGKGTECGVRCVLYTSPHTTALAW